MTTILRILKKKTITEATGYSSKTFHGVKIYVNGESKQIDTAVKLCNQYWDEILDEAAERMFKHVKEIDFDGTPEKFRTKEAIRKGLKVDNCHYDNEGGKHNPICGMMSIGFDTNPPLDKFHYFSLYVDFDANKKISFNSVYDG